MIKMGLIFFTNLLSGGMSFAFLLPVHFDLGNFT
jgi:hypothetical protein